MPLSTSSVDRRIPEALSTSRGRPAGVRDGNWIQTMPGEGRNTILRPRNPESLSRLALTSARFAFVAVLRARASMGTSFRCHNACCAGKSSGMRAILWLIWPELDHIPIRAFLKQNDASLQFTAQHWSVTLACHGAQLQVEIGAPAGHWELDNSLRTNVSSRADTVEKVSVKEMCNWNFKQTNPVE
jgi:hypothetical protein